uniref:hypothetical protein n=1 Tax=Prevotella sp. TaxID=59823 RepID=UPI003FEEE3A5
MVYIYIDFIGFCRRAPPFGTQTRTIPCLRQRCVAEHDHVVTIQRDAPASYSTTV